MEYLGIGESGGKRPGDDRGVKDYLNQGKSTRWGDSQQVPAPASGRELQIIVQTDLNFSFFSGVGFAKPKP